MPNATVVRVLSAYRRYLAYSFILVSSFPLSLLPVGSAISSYGPSIPDLSRRNMGVNPHSYPQKTGPGSQVPVCDGIVLSSRVPLRSQSPMPTLVIVESPTKARTIQRYLPSGHVVLASMGHVRDLPSSA